MTRITRGLLGIVFFLIVVSSSVYVASSSTSYGDTLGKTVIKAVVPGSEQGDWKPVSYPTDNFGIATLYDGKGAGSLLCATATCLGLADNKTETLKAAGYIESGRGGPVTLDETQKRTLGVNIVMTLYSLVGLSGKYDNSHSTVVDVQIPGATLRYLLKGKLSGRLIANPATPAVTDAYNGRRIRAVMADIVADSISATVKVDNSADAEVKANLDKNVGKVLGKDASLGVTYNKTGDGTYKVETTFPVVIAVAVVKQPKSGTLEGDTPDSWTGWTPDLQLHLKTDQ